MITHAPHRDFALLSGSLALLASSAALASPPLEMGNWTLVDPDADWVYSNPSPTSGLLKETEGSSGVQAAWVVSAGSAAQSATITFTLQVLAGTGDDDIIGFIFGYQDSENFHLLDWKKNTQSFNWGDPVPQNDDVAEQGLKIKRIVDGWTLDGLWGGSDGLGVTTLAGPAGGGWNAGTTYAFEVQLSPGQIIVMRDGAPLFNVVDESFPGGSGQFGFYGFSQNNVQLADVCVSNLVSDCPFDVDESGTVDGADLGLMLANWGDSPAAGDVNGDGVVNGSDLGLLLAAWGGDGC